MTKLNKFFSSTGMYEQIKGKRRTVWLPEKLDRKAEKVRKALGLSNSGFYRFAIIEVIKQFHTGKSKPRRAKNEQMPKS
jgi:hypothetical protein